jgi:hypothetical protein
MADVMTTHLREMSYDDLLQLFVNAVSLIVKEKQVEAAKRTITEIQNEWGRRRKLGDAFIDFNRPELGMLAALGSWIEQYVASE